MNFLSENIDLFINIGTLVLIYVIIYYCSKVIKKGDKKTRQIIEKAALDTLLIAASLVAILHFAFLSTSVLDKLNIIPGIATSIPQDGFGFEFQTIAIIFVLAFINRKRKVEN